MVANDEQHFPSTYANLYSNRPAKNTIWPYFSTNFFYLATFFFYLATFFFYLATFSFYLATSSLYLYKFAFQPSGQNFYLAIFLYYLLPLATSSFYWATFSCQRNTLIPTQHCNAVRQLRHHGGNLTNHIPVLHFLGGLRLMRPHMHETLFVIG